MSSRRDGHTQAAAAARAGFSERTGRRVEAQPMLPSQKAPRSYRTRNHFWLAYSGWRFVKAICGGTTVTKREIQVAVDMAFASLFSAFVRPVRFRRSSRVAP